MVLRTRLRLGTWANEIRGFDVFLARNLETLAFAAAARVEYAPGARLAYECLDIHRLLLSDRVWGTCLRWIEKRLLRKTDLLLISSPAFARNISSPGRGSIGTSGCRSFWSKIKCCARSPRRGRRICIRVPIHLRGRPGGSDGLG